jgi:hypothetical protein
VEQPPVAGNLPDQSSDTERERGRSDQPEERPTP